MKRVRNDMRSMIFNKNINKNIRILSRTFRHIFIKTYRCLTGAIRNYAKLFPSVDREAVFYFSKFVQMRALFADELRVEEAKMDEKGRRRRRRRREGKACVSDH